VVQPVVYLYEATENRMWLSSDWFITYTETRHQAGTISIALICVLDDCPMLGSAKWRSQLSRSNHAQDPNQVQEPWFLPENWVFA